MSYTFQKLSPLDFEELSRDLLQAEYGYLFESFANGRDGGIDFRYAKYSDRIIVQCKHYEKSGYSKLKSKLKTESDQVKKLSPTRYVLTTSVSLSPANKTEIRNTLNNIPNEADIIGADDLNNLIRLHPSIEKKHFKLWLDSTNILQSVLHHGQQERSKFELEDINNQIERYVLSDAFGRALKLLEANRLVIISGQPGVGKTTLARMLIYHHLKEGWEFIAIGSDVQEARNLYQFDKNQIFYFDDFLGATFFGEMPQNQDNELLRFIEFVRKSKNAGLILTTREHILQQAFSESEKLNSASSLTSKCTLNISDYSQKQKARILFNHLYFSELPKEYINCLLENDFVLKIVKHSKFNPRIIEWLSDYTRVKNIPTKEYVEFAQNLLDDPSEIWMHAYQKQISEGARSILLSLFLETWPIKTEELEQLFGRIHQIRSQKYNFKTTAHDFSQSLKECEGAFVQILDRGISFINPSVTDVLNTHCAANPQTVFVLLESANNFGQVQRVWNLLKSDKFENALRQTKKQFNTILKAVNRSFSAASDKPLENCFNSYTDNLQPSGRLRLVCEIAQKFKCKQSAEMLKNSIAHYSAEVSAGEDFIHGAGELYAWIKKDEYLSKFFDNTFFETNTSQLVKTISGSKSPVVVAQAIQMINRHGGRIDFEPLLEKVSHDLDSVSIDSEIWECQNLDDLEELIEAIETVELELGIDLSDSLYQAETKRSEMENEDDNSLGGPLDEYKAEQSEFKNDAELVGIFAHLIE